MKRPLRTVVLVSERAPHAPWIREQHAPDYDLADLDRDTSTQSLAAPMNQSPLLARKRLCMAAQSLAVA
jgi:hypothetical protein